MEEDTTPRSPYGTVVFQDGITLNGEAMTRFNLITVQRNPTTNQPVEGEDFFLTQLKLRMAQSFVIPVSTG